nr:hypothetical protein [Tanacetum cinerariifolium]
NISYLSNFEPFDGGYVSFGQGGCRITGKGTIKTECIVLGRNFKLLDDPNILLRTPMQHNMRLGHLNVKTMNKLVSHNLVRGLPTKSFDNNHTCTACLKGKQHKASCKSKLVNSVTKPLHTLHMDLFGPTSDETSSILRKFITEIENLKDLKVKIIRTHAIGFLKPFGCHVMILNILDNLGKFEAKGDEGYFIGYLMSSKAFRVINKRTKRVEENLHAEFLENKAIEKGAGPNWLFDIDSLTKSMNYVPVDAGTNSTNLSGTKDAANQEVKKDVSSLRYSVLPNWAHDSLLESSSSKPHDESSSQVPKGSGNPNPTVSSSNPPADQMETLIVESPIPTVSSLDLTACLNDSPEPSSEARLISKRVSNQEETPSLDNILSLTNRFEYILGVTTSSDETIRVEADVSNMETSISASPTPTLRIHKDHPKSQIIGHNLRRSLMLCKTKAGWKLCKKSCFNSKSKKSRLWLIVLKGSDPLGQNRIEAIRLFLAYASFMGFTVYQMDVKSAFLYGTIEEEVYVMQPPGFQDPAFPAKVYKVEKAIYGLHQAPRAWYGTLSKYLLKNGFQRGTIDQTIFIRRQREDFILVQVYLCREFKALMHEKFQMSAMGELNFFLGLQVLQEEDGIFLSHDKHQVTLKECHFHAVKRIF